MRTFIFARQQDHTFAAIKIVLLGVAGGIGCLALAIVVFMFNQGILR